MWVTRQRRGGHRRVFWERAGLDPSLHPPRAGRGPCAPPQPGGQLLPSELPVFKYSTKVRGRPGRAGAPVGDCPLLGVPGAGDSPDCSPGPVSAVCAPVPSSLRALGLGGQGSGAAGRRHAPVTPLWGPSHAARTPAEDPSAGRRAGPPRGRTREPVLLTLRLGSYRFTSVLTCCSASCVSVTENYTVRVPGAPTRRPAHPLCPLPAQR